MGYRKTVNKADWSKKKIKKIKKITKKPVKIKNLNVEKTFIVCLCADVCTCILVVDEQMGK